MEAKLLVVFCVVFLYTICVAKGRLLSQQVQTASTGTGTFNVKNYGARGDGLTDDTKAFHDAWKAACSSSGVVTLLAPIGTYFVGPTQFHGPCPNVHSLTFLLQGTLKASTDLSKYGNDWVEFGWIDHLTFTGGGTLDGQGPASWPFNKCPVQKDCKVLPTNLLFLSTNNTVFSNITSLNSKFFHIALLQNHNIKISGVRITAPQNSPNTDGIHIERNTGVTISDSIIGTGDDCISIGQGNNGVEISKINCGPGHGMSIGSLGRYVGEGNVTGIHMRDITFTNTMNGVRIKTWENSPSRSIAANMSFENMVMRGVQNPIIIDQKYCPYASCEHKFPSGVTISDIHFRNITGTSTTPVAVTLKCGVPCQNVTLHDVNLKYTGPDRTTAHCLNIKARYTGMQIPPPCF